jgi:hypothetical protein
MDFWSAIIGALVGAGVCGVVWWLVERNDAARAPSVSSPETSASASAPVATADATPEPPDVARSDPLRADSHANPTPTPPPVDDEGPDSTVQLEISTSNASRAERQKEAKESGWSYTMEQILRRYLATHNLSSQFDIKVVDCRTSFCEIEAFASSERAMPAWDQIIIDIKDQPWNEFGPRGTSMSMQSDRPLITTTLWREQPVNPSPADASAAAKRP